MVLQGLWEVAREGEGEADSGQLTVDSGARRTSPLSHPPRTSRTWVHSDVSVQSRVRVHITGFLYTTGATLHLLPPSYGLHHVAYKEGLGGPR